MSAWSDAVAATTPYLWWKLDETVGTTAADSSGNGRTGSYYTSSVTYSHASLIPGDAGGSSVEFTSTQGNVSKSSGLSYPRHGVTFATTIQSTDSTGRLFQASGETFLNLSASAITVSVYPSAASQWSAAISPAAIFDGSPHLLVWVIRPASSELWLDGVKVDDHTHTAAAATFTSFHLKQVFSGSVGRYDDTLIWNTDLSASQIGNLSAAWAGAAPATPEVAADLSGAGSFVATTTAIATATAGLSGSGDFSATVETVGPSSVTADLTGSGEFSAVVGIVQPPATTDTANRSGGRIRSGYGVATWSPAVTPAPAQAGRAVIKARAFGPVAMQGTQPTYTTSEASTPAARQRIVVGGKDITYFRDVATPEVEYQLAEPLLYGPATLTLPQVAVAFETIGTGPLKWLRPGKSVRVDLVLDDVVVKRGVYKGVVIAFDTDGPDLRVEIGGQAQGRAALMNRQVPIFDTDHDLGALAFFAIRELGLPFSPLRGPRTGITLGRFGGMGHLDYIHEIVARGWTRKGNQWTIMPGDDDRYRMEQKDTTTVDFTIFADDARSVASLRRDTAEEPSRVFVTGVTPEGQRVRFGAYPGLVQSRPAPYPFTDGRAFDEGTTNADTDTGDGITVMLGRLRMLGYLSADASAGGYDSDVTDAISSVQEDAGLPVASGNMNEATWAALYDLDVTDRTARGARIRPAAERRYGRKWNWSAAGSIMGRNPHYDPARLKVDLNVDMGAGFTRQRMREWARAELKREDNWVGTVTLHTGAVLRGDLPVGASVAEADLMDAREIRPGMNARLPQFDGGILVHISGVEVLTDSVRLTVDTQARDAMKVWEVITRNREARNSPARRWMGNRSSTEIKDSIDIWDEVGGEIDGDVDLVAGWNKIPVVAGQAGTVARLRLELATPAEFACAVFGRDINPERLNRMITAPLTQAGTEKWENRATSKRLEDMLLLYSAGTKDEPCGYSPGSKSGVAPLRGVHRDEAGFGYRCRIARPFLYILVWVPAANKLKGGRVMWPQLEAGV